MLSREIRNRKGRSTRRPLGYFTIIQSICVRLLINYQQPMETLANLLGWKELEIRINNGLLVTAHNGISLINGSNGSIHF